MMRWPFVSRLAFDLITAERDYWRAKCERLTDPKPAPPPAALPAPQKSDPVTAAIRDVAGTNGGLRTQLAHFVRDERRKGTPERDIELMVLDWDYRPSSADIKRDREHANAVMADILDG